MKKYVKILLAVMLVCTLVFTVSAEVAEKPYAGKWSLSEDGETLRCGDQVFEWYPLPPGEVLRPDRMYVYEQEIQNPVNGDFLSILVSPDSPEMVFLCDGYWANCPERVYVTAEGRRILDAYSRREFSSWRISYPNWNKCAELSSDALRHRTTEEITMEAMRLRDVPVRNLMGYDETGTLAHAVGAVYEINDWLYYVDYDELPNYYFTVEGKFSYRSGTVTLQKLGKEDMDEVSRLLDENMYIWWTVYTREEDQTDLDMPDNVARITFFAMSVVLGLIVPGVPLVLGLVFTRSKKSQNPGRWYLLSILSALWIIIFAILVIRIMTT